jgi:hypothetical protein
MAYFDVSPEIKHIIRIHRDINFSLHKQMFSFRPFDDVFDAFQPLYFSGDEGYGQQYEWENINE